MIGAGVVMLLLSLVVVSVGIGGTSVGGRGGGVNLKVDDITIHAVIIMPIAVIHHQDISRGIYIYIYQV